MKNDGCFCTFTSLEESAHPVEGHKGQIKMTKFWKDLSKETFLYSCPYSEFLIWRFLVSKSECWPFGQSLETTAKAPLTKSFFISTEKHIPWKKNCSLNVDKISERRFFEIELFPFKGKIYFYRNVFSHRQGCSPPFEKWGSPPLLGPFLWKKLGWPEVLFYCKKSGGPGPPGQLGGTSLISIENWFGRYRVDISPKLGDIYYPSSNWSIRWCQPC